MTVAFIPVRGGSKSIPLKNIKKICEKPLVYWAIKAACECKYIDKVYVATDSEIIKETIESFEELIIRMKTCVIERSKESATDTASTEMAMLEFAEKYDFTNIVLIQATSPLLSADDLNNGFLKYSQEGVDSVLSVVKQKRFEWDENEEGVGFPTNYDVYCRPRRQDFKGYFVENGAFYITSKDSLVHSKNRVSGKIALAEMNEDTFFEIDEPSDWVIVEQLMRRKIKTINIPQNIKMLLTDCDGCLTDGGMYYSENGDELKKFNTKDGMAFSILKSKGINYGIITGENVELNKRRAQKINADIYIPNCKNKMDAVLQICEEYNIELENIAYVGDDINDLEVIQKVGFSCAPADAILEIKNNADFIADSKGGEGVIREVVAKLFEE